MISDFLPPKPRKPNRIEPLSDTSKPTGPPLHEQAKAADPTFKTPEEVAAEEAEQPSPFLPMVVDQPPAPNKPGKQQRLKRRRFSLGISWGWGRKRLIIAGATLAVLLLAGTAAAWAQLHHTGPKPVAVKKTVVKEPAPPPPVYSTLTGLQVADETVNQRPVTGIMIENSMDARPQSGLGDAGVVFEAIAEGGITRFLALYQDSAPADIGPIRSARPYYIQWLLGFDAAYAHVGGSPQALSDIKSLGVKDMNQFAYGGYYHRITTRAAPHNVYTSMSTLNQLESERGYTSTYTGFARATKEEPSKTPDATSIDFDVSSYTYNPHYAYNATTNSYDRSEAGAAHMDAGSGKQISPKVVVAMVLPFGRGEPNGSGYYSDYKVIGSGTAYIFQNGTVITATWTKTANTTQITFTDPAGKAVPLAPGNTWISAVSATSSVSYK